LNSASATCVKLRSVILPRSSVHKAFADRELNRAFVLMEYFGYLRRDPDAPGYNHWLGKLNFYGNYIDAEMVCSFTVSPEYRQRFGQ
jgi:hypothetical protein